jgi:hypothetical protein
MLTRAETAIPVYSCGLITFLDKFGNTDPMSRIYAGGLGRFSLFF